ncbi:MAG TPA: prepilin-type N-terminal cleavage/methylation domain-containing protein [Thermodesulfovibrionales bacterium]|nr:prepilin-type N-terminal cleavage/methylation domain-containing protein [Thermodesulfovibrionales bacterium]
MRDIFRTGSGRPERYGTLRKTGGFSLLELIIVIFLITLVLGLSTVFFAKTLFSSRLTATARDLSATIRYARALAQINGERQVVSIDLDSKSYGIEGKGSKSIPADVMIKVIDPLSGEVPRGKFNINVNGIGGIDGGKIVLSSGKQSLSIETDPIVGTVMIK